jgi:uncharacterized protein (TIGR02271 family)
MSDNTTGRETRATIGAFGRAGGHASKATERATERFTGTAFDTAMASGLSWLELMARMQRASLASFSVYSPGTNTRVSAARPEDEREAVVALGEERLNVATRTVLGETTRIRRRVVASPVEQEVTLRDERVVLERRPARAGSTAHDDLLTDTVIEMSDSRQLPQVWKTVHLAEEVVLRREVTERKETVRETLRRDVVEVEHDQQGRALQVVSEAQPANALAEVGRAVKDGTVQAARDTAQTEAQAAANAEALAHAAAEATRPRVEPEPSAEERRRREGVNKDQPQPGRKG